MRGLQSSSLYSSLHPSLFSHHNMAVVRFKNINRCTHTHTHNCHFIDIAIPQRWYPDECNEASRDSIKHTYSLTWVYTSKDTCDSQHMQLPRLIHLQLSTVTRLYEQTCAHKISITAIKAPPFTAHSAKKCSDCNAISQLHASAHRTTHRSGEIKSENEQSAKLCDNTQGDSLSAIWFLTE